MEKVSFLDKLIGMLPEKAQKFVKPVLIIILGVLVYFAGSNELVDMAIEYIKGYLTSTEETAMLLTNFMA